MNGQAGSFSACGGYGPDVTLEREGYEGAILVDRWLAEQEGLLAVAVEG